MSATPRRAGADAAPGGGAGRRPPRLEVQEGEQVLHLEVRLVDGGDPAQEGLQGALGLGDGAGVEGEVRPG